MIKAAIFDLDSTLINTQKIKKIIFGFIKKIAKFNDEEAVEIYNRARSRNGEITFSLGRLEEELKKEIKNFDEKRWREFVDNFGRSRKNLLIKGAGRVINFFRKNNIPVYILTLGVKEWQWDKIKFSGLDKLLADNYKNIKYTTQENADLGKINEIKEILKELNLNDGAEIIFFNDRPDETATIMKAFPALKVFLRRENQDKRHTDEDFTNLGKNKNIIKISDDLNLIEDIKKLLC